MRRTLCLLLLCLVCILQRPAGAQVLFNFNPAGLTGQPGDTLVFNATLTNTGSDPVFLNGDSVNLASANLQFDDTPYFNNFPLFLAGGDTTTADIFSVLISPTAMNGVYGGSFQVVGGADNTAQAIVGQQNFLVTVSAVPEPGSLGILGIGIVTGIVLMHCRKRRISAIRS